MMLETTPFMQSQDVIDERSVFFQMLVLDPLNADAYDGLGSTLQGNDWLRLPDGQDYDKKGLHARAIELDPTNSNAHNNLGVALGAEGTIALIDGTVASALELFRRAAWLDPSNAVAICNLGVALDERDVVELRDRKARNKRDLYIRALELNPSYAFAYNNLANLLAEDELVYLSAERYDRKQLYIKALELDPAYAIAYNNLGMILSKGEQIRLADGSVWDKQALHTRALRLNPQHACAYRHLAIGTSGNNGRAAEDEIAAITNRDMALDECARMQPSSRDEGGSLSSDALKQNEQQMACRSGGLGPGNAALSAHEPDSELMSMSTCAASDTLGNETGFFLAAAWKAVEADPLNASAYAQLGAFLGPGEDLELPGGYSWTRRDLLKTAVNLDPACGRYRNLLGVTLGPTERVRLADGSTQSRAALFASAVELDASLVMGFYNLLYAHHDMEEKVMTADSVSLRVSELRKRIQELDPSGVKACMRSSSTARGSSKVREETVGEGFVETRELISRSLDLHERAAKLLPRSSLRLVSVARLRVSTEQDEAALESARKSRRESLTKALSLDPSSIAAHNDLALDLEVSERIELLDGTSKSREELLMRTMELEPECAVIYDNLRDLKASLLTDPSPQRVDVPSEETTTFALDESGVKTFVFDRRYSTVFCVGQKSRSTIAPARALAGSERAKRDLLASIESDVTCAEAFNSLGRQLGSKEFVKRRNGIAWSKKDLLHKAVELAPSAAEYIMDLALILHPRERILVLALREETTCSQLDLLEKSLALNPQSSAANCNFGVALARAEAEGAPRSAAGPASAAPLFARAVELDGENAAAFANLAACLACGEVTKLPAASSDGAQEWTSRALLLRALELDPSNAVALSNLAARGERETEAAERLSYAMRALEYEPGLGAACHNLALALSDLGDRKRIIGLPDGSRCGLADLFARAAEAEPRCAAALNNLAASLPDGVPAVLALTPERDRNSSDTGAAEESTVLEQPKPARWTREALFRRAARLDQGSAAAGNLRLELARQNQSKAT